MSAPGIESAIEKVIRFKPALQANTCLQLGLRLVATARESKRMLEMAGTLHNPRNLGAPDYTSVRDPRFSMALACWARSIQDLFPIDGGQDEDQ